MDVRQKVAEQIGTLVLANIELAAQVESLTEQLQSSQEREGLRKPQQPAEGAGA